MGKNERRRLQGAINKIKWNEICQPKREGVNCCHSFCKKKSESTSYFYKITFLIFYISMFFYVFQFFNFSIFLCFDVSIFLFFDVSIFLSSYLVVYLCLRSYVPILLCPLYPNFYVSLSQSHYIYI